MTAAAVVWLGALLGPLVAWPLGAAIAGGGLVLGRRSRSFLLLAAIGVGMASGALAEARSLTTLSADLPRGSGVVTGTARTDAIPYGNGARFVIEPVAWTRGHDSVEWRGPALAVLVDTGAVTAGDRVDVAGSIQPAAGTLRGDPVAGRIRARWVTVHDGTASPWLEAGNAVRSRVRSRISALGASAEAGLLAGFLIGDTSGLARDDTEALRRAGLTHYVAVSGSNVALVLGGWWLVLGPTGASTRVRAATGLIVLVVFIIATRWESSVIRAATMASLVMGGKAMGIVLDGWAALGGAVVVLLTVSGDLAFDIGFQLSAVATAGVLATLRLWRSRSPRWLWAVVAATAGAQASVVPLLLLHFGTVPLLSPLANVIAAPLVTGATAAAGAGVIVNWDLPLRIAEPLAGGVLAVARVAAGWPQLNAITAAALIGLMALVWATPLRRPAIAVVAAASILSMVPPGPPAVPTVVFLDVGQGDAVLLRDPSGSVALVDGGRDPSVLRSALRRYGVTSIDLLVASHGDADHVGGLVDLPGDVTVGSLWYPDYAASSDLLDELMAAASSEGADITAVRHGDRAQLGEFTLDVIGPGRRYAADNDGSVVLLVSVDGTRVLLPGDIGAVAQQELPTLRPEALLVPHHGAATTDIDWLAATVGRVAVISVGPNNYGHPAPDIVATLRDAGTTIVTTEQDGDIAIALR